MGFRIAWLAFHGRSREDVLTALHLADTGEHDEANESPMSLADFPDGWTVLWLNRFDHPFAEDASLRLFSQGCTVIAGHTHEGIMFGATELYRDGASVWAVFHDARQGIEHLETAGALPDGFEAIRKDAFAAQAAGTDNVDHIIDIPFAMARALCGFQYDRYAYDWGEPRFTVVRHKSELQ